MGSLEEQPETGFKFTWFFLREYFSQNFIKNWGKQEREEKELNKKTVSGNVLVVLEERRPVFEHPYLSVFGCGLWEGRMVSRIRQLPSAETHSLGEGRGCCELLVVNTAVRGWMHQPEKGIWAENQQHQLKLSFHACLPCGRLLFTLARISLTTILWGRCYQHPSLQFYR